MEEIKHGQLLKVEDLRVSFFTPAGEVKAVGGISYQLHYDEVMGIVGESGSGKSVEAYSIMGLLQSPGRVVGGAVTFEGRDVLAFNKAQMTAFRGGEVSMIFQNPMTCLNPVYTVGTQLVEALRTHDKKVSRKEAAKRAMEMLELVGINNVAKRMRQYPHEFSGGMRQRVMIAMALICRPKLLIADEPTTALDVTIQAQILELMKSLQKKTHMGIIFITHNLGVVAEICDKVSVMYAGRMVEQGPVDDIFYRPGHPYTVGLLRSMPRVDAEAHERLIPIEGTPVDMLNLLPGCPFAPRCEHATDDCRKEMPPYTELSEGHRSACWLRVWERQDNRPDLIVGADGRLSDRFQGDNRPELPRIARVDNRPEPRRRVALPFDLTDPRPEPRRRDWFSADTDPRPTPQRREWTDADIGPRPAPQRREWTDADIGPRPAPRRREWLGADIDPRPEPRRREWLGADIDPRPEPRRRDWAESVLDPRPEPRRRVWIDEDLDPRPEPKRTPREDEGINE